MNVLIVDDNESAADLLQELLSLQDHTAHCCYTAQQGLDAAAARHFDAALIDLSLPDLPGSEVARQLRNGADRQSMLLVTISGYSEQDASAAQTRALFDHYLQKPIDFDALDRILAAPRAHAAA